MNQSAVLGLLLSLLLFSCQSRDNVSSQPDGMIVLEPATGPDLANTDPLPDHIPVLDVDFYSKEGYFVSSFPYTPSTSIKRIPTKRGEIEVHSFTCEFSGTKVYLLSYSDHPSGLVRSGDPINFLIDAKNGIVEKLGPETAISKERQIEKDGFPGIAFQAKAGEFNASYELYLAGNRLYELMILRDGLMVDWADMQQFSRNFKIVYPLES